MASFEFPDTAPIMFNTDFPGSISDPGTIDVGHYQIDTRCSSQENLGKTSFAATFQFGGEAKDQQACCCALALRPTWRRRAAPSDAISVRQFELEYLLVLY